MSAFTGCGVLRIDEPMIHFSDWTKVRLLGGGGAA